MGAAGEFAHDRPPVQEARHRGPAGVSRSLRPAAQRRGRGRARVLSAAARQPGNALPPAPAGRRSAAFSRRGGAERRRRRPFRRSRAYAGFATAAGGKEMSTTMAVVRILGALLKDQEIGPRIVPIVADEARTFGMASLFRQIGIYAPAGPALRARGRRLAAVLPRGEGRTTLGGGHHRGGRGFVMDGGGDRLQRPRPARCCRSISTIRCSAFSGSAT